MLLWPGIEIDGIQIFGLATDYKNVESEISK